MLVDLSEYDFAAHPQLLARLRESAHNYFRFVNEAFAGMVCQRYVSSSSPQVNLHGDAHLEQYAISPEGRGLEDFDAATTGAAEIDLVRFGTSLRLAARARFPGSEPRLIQAFGNEGYGPGLREEPYEGPVPAIARRVLEEHSLVSAEGFLAGATESMQPLTAADERAVREGVRLYAEQQGILRPDQDPRFYDVVRVGGLRMGIGSALDGKFLFRVRGPSDAPGDDLILEGKRVRAPAGGRCISNTNPDDPVRVLVGAARLGNQANQHLGFVVGPDSSYWIHEWVSGYHELSLAEDPQSADELAEVAREVGWYLATGHLRDIGAPLDRLLRHALLETLDRDQEVLLQATVEMTDEVERAWRAFRRATESIP